MTFFDWLSDSAGSFFDDLDGFLEDNGADIVKAGTKAFSGSSSGSSSGGSSSTLDPSDYFVRSDSTNELARQLINERGQTDPVQSVDAKEILRDWSIRLREFSGE